MNLGNLRALVLIAASLGVQSAFAAGGHYAVTQQIEAPEGAWTFASIDHTKHQMYVGRSSGILEFDLQSHKTRTLDGNGKRVQMVVPVPGSAVVVGTQDTTNSAVLVDISNGSVAAQIPAGRRPETAAYDPATGLVAVMGGSAEVTLIDAKTKAAVGSIPVEGILESGATDGKGHLYINLEDKHAIAVVDLSARKMTGSFPMKDCKEPTGLGYDSKLNVLISSCSNNVAKVIDAGSGADLGSIQIAGGPDAVLVDSERRVAFVPCSEGRLAVISLASTKPVLSETVVTAQGAKTGAIDPTTGKLYIPVGRAPETDFGGRAIPGFAILVVERKS
ncbi:MAG: hypothetical protein JSR66_28405 [Proteobacteria bacterium]|nr:hypothetical protein [Pseudomonadota bacterium]